MTIFKKETLIILCILIIGSTFVFKGFLMTPRIGWDEGLNLNLAKNIAEFGRWQIQESPGEFSGQTHYYSIGWTTLFPIAIVFKIFGPSFMGARIFTAFYLIGFLILSFLLSKRWFGVNMAILSVLLIIFFPPLYTYGKPLLGEIPSMFWLTLGVLFFEKTKNKEKILSASLFGFCLGAAAASKLTYVLLLSPVVAVVALAYFMAKKISLRWLLAFGVSFVVAISPAIWFSFLNGALNSSFAEVLSFYANNHVSDCVICDIKNNLMGFLTIKILIYTAILIIISFLIATKIFLKNKKLSYLSWGAALYGMVTLLYFIKSPGVVRYLLPLQLIIIFIAPAVIMKVADYLSVFLNTNKAFVRKIALASILLLVAVNVFMIVFSGYATPSIAPVITEDYVKNQLPKDGMIGVINLPAIAAVVPPDILVNYIRIDNKTDRTIGINPLILDKGHLPKYLIFDNSNDKNEKDIKPYAQKIKNSYRMIFEADSYVIFSHI